MSVGKNLSHSRNCYPVQKPRGLDQTAGGLKSCPRLRGWEHMWGSTSLQGDSGPTTAHGEVRDSTKQGRAGRVRPNHE